MCDAEEDLRRAERENARLGEDLDLILRLVEDAERGIWSLAELRRKVSDVVDGNTVYA